MPPTLKRVGVVRTRSGTAPEQSMSQDQERAHVDQFFLHKRPASDTGSFLDGARSA